MGWVVPWEDLDPPQQQAIQWGVRDNLVVEGGPGAGKSLVLVYRAAELLRKGIEPGRLLVVGFTNALEDYLAAGLEELGVPADRVRTMDSLCGDLYEDLVGRRPPVIKNDRDRWKRDFDEVRHVVAERLRGSRSHKYDAILVDEGQDFDGQDFGILMALSTHITVAADARQQLYKKTTLGDIEEAIGAVRFPLNWGFRSTPEVIAVASAFGGFEGLVDLASCQNPATSRF